MALVEGGIDQRLAHRRVGLVLGDQQRQRVGRIGTLRRQLLLQIVAGVEQVGGQAARRRQHHRRHDQKPELLNQGNAFHRCRFQVIKPSAFILSINCRQRVSRSTLELGAAPAPTQMPSALKLNTSGSAVGSA
ncbi:hypothetical protein D3C85_1320940 [compost metagenome]